MRGRTKSRQADVDKPKGRPRKPPASQELTLAPPTQPVKPPRKPRSPTRTDSARARAVLIREFYKSIPEARWDEILGSKAAAAPPGKLLALINDPSFRTWSIEKKCQEAGIEFQELVRLVSDHTLGAAIIGSAEHIPEVLDGLADDAKSKFLVCDLCLDLADEGDDYTSIVVDHPRIPGEKLKIECPKCGGVGKTRRMGDARARETFLKLHGGLEEAPAATVQLNQQFNFGSQHSMSVHRGQQLLEAGRMRSGTAPASGQRETINVTANTNGDQQS